MKTKTIALLAASAVTLAACSGSKTDEQPVGETNVTNLVVEQGNLMNVATEAPPATRIDNTANAVPPSATLTTDEQTQDDADATGMTAKVNRDEGGNDSGQPAH
jgi:PBP1b-binding outer membrane lipoprotein LpoB